jgi:hypothetical protein
MGDTAKCENMWTVILPLKSSELSTQMAAMRIWLDERRFEPSSFSCRDNNAAVIVRVDFKVADEAHAFARQFNGQIDNAVADVESPPAHAEFLLR